MSCSRRVHGEPEAVRRKTRSTLSASLPGAVAQIHTMDEILDVQRYPFRASYWVSAAIGGLALLLTLSGVYGVLSYLVTQRTKEIGIRVALGACTGSVAGLVLKQSLKFSAAGTAIGARGRDWACRASWPRRWMRFCLTRLTSRHMERWRSW